MQFLGRFSLVVLFCCALEVQKRILEVFFRLVLMDCISFLNGLSQSSAFNGGFLVFGFFSPALNVLGLLLLFVLSLKLSQFSCSGEGLVQFLCGVRGKSGETRDGLDSKKVLDEGRDLKIVSCECDSVNLLENYKSRCKVGSSVRNEVENFVTSDVVVDDDDNASDCCPEDEEFDVTVLRKMVKSERQRTDEAYAELEKERGASASAAEEAMSMVLRLQSAMSSMDIEASQYRKLAEQKQEYGQEVIQSLRWIITKHESERNALVEKLRLCRGKLKQYRSSDEMDHFEGLGTTLGFMDSAVEDGLVDNGKWQ